MPGEEEFQELFASLDPKYLEAGEPTPPEGEEQTDPDEDATPKEGEEGEEGKSEETDPTPEDKGSKAFAAMRVENTKYKKLLAKLAESTGLSEEELIDKLDNQATESVAKKQNMSPEALRRLEALEQQNQALAQEKLENDFRTNMTELKTSLKLEDKEVMGFIEQMVAKGIDPLQPPMDVEVLYKAMNLDKILKKAVDDAVQETIKNQGKAGDASEPNSSKGKGSSGEGEEIKSMSDFERLLNSANK